MGTPKRKRQLEDSAIADMSSQGTHTAEPSTQSSGLSNLTRQDEAQDSPTKRRKDSLTQLRSDPRNFETAASLRPRRRTVSQPLLEAPISLGSENLDGASNPQACDDSNVGDDPLQQVSAWEVKGSAEHHTHERECERNRTPERERTPEQEPKAPATPFPTPPQTVEKLSTGNLPQSSPRRSTRERRPPERYQPYQVEQTTPTRKNPRAGRLGANLKKGEPAIANQESRMVLLKISMSETLGSDLSTSLTGSFSFRSRSVDSPDRSAIETNSFQEPETFAQPRPEPILADTQDLYSSQNEPDVEAHATALQTSKDSPRERFRASSRHDGVQSQAVINNQSWRTEPTQPLNPPEIATSPTDSRQSSPLSFHASQATTIDEGSQHIPPPRYALRNQELHEIAARLFAHRNLTPKPEPLGKPAVWAETRMDLCETLHYFRAYQGACHSTGGFVRGFMFDKVAGTRDYIDSNVVIARAGGGQTKDKESGEMRPAKDQVEGTICQSLRNCMSHYNPVVIITGVDNPHMPSQPPHQYCVLDYFKPTHVWSEMSEGKHIVRYRFEKLNVDRQSWWRAKNIEDTIGLGDLPPPLSKPCGTCAREFPQIYLNGWMCLHPTCGSFWRIFPSGRDSPEGSEPYEPEEAALVYDPRFLKSHTPWPNDDHTYPLTSNDATTSPHALPGEDTSEAFTRGVVCAQCGRCNSRLSWTGWACPCGWTKTPPHTLIPALSTREPLWPLSGAYTGSRDTHSPSVGVHVSFAHGYRINRYTLPGISGFVTHMIANASVVQAPGGADDMFEVLQREDIGLARRRMDSSMLKGGLWTRHFTVNFGMPYKFVAAAETRPFPADPTHTINAAREQMDWAARYLFSSLPAAPNGASSLAPSSFAEPSPDTSSPSQSQIPPFNELLALGYFESQRISYHDDGESGLGPTIATLSLGAPGTMRIRLKAKHHTGISKAGVFIDAPPLPGSLSYAARAKLIPELQELKKKVSPAQYLERLRAAPKQLGLVKGKNAAEALALRLGHGDVVLMHGEDVQRYFEHAVEHEGKLRFALTCRWVDPESLSEEERGRHGERETGVEKKSIEEMETGVEKESLEEREPEVEVEEETHDEMGVEGKSNEEMDVEVEKEGLEEVDVAVEGESHEEMDIEVEREIHEKIEIAVERDTHDEMGVGGESNEETETGVERESHEEQDVAVEKGSHDEMDVEVQDSHEEVHVEVERESHEEVQPELAAENESHDEMNMALQTERHDEMDVEAETSSHDAHSRHEEGEVRVESESHNGGVIHETMDVAVETGEIEAGVQREHDAMDVAQKETEA